jgi:hypothetical protein
VANKPLPDVRLEETGRTREVAADAPLPGTANRKVFAKGPVRGSVNYRGDSWPFFAWLMLDDGRWFDFHRVAKMDDPGVVDLAQVGVGNEIIIYPGVIYRRGIANPSELGRWRAAQQRIEAKLAERASVGEGAAAFAKMRNTGR